MTVSNFGIASVLTDVFGVTATQIIDYLLTSEEFDEKEFRKLIKGLVCKKTDASTFSIQSYELHANQKLSCNLLVSKWITWIK